MRAGNRSSSMPTLVKERRAHERTPLARVCKVYHRPSRRYMAAATIDVSTGGLALRLDRRGRVAPGDLVDVAIAWENAGLVRADSMIPGRVVRVVNTRDGAVSAAVTLEAEQATSLAAA